MSWSTSGIKKKRVRLSKNDDDDDDDTNFYNDDENRTTTNKKILGGSTTSQIIKSKKSNIRNQLQSIYKAHMNETNKNFQTKIRNELNNNATVTNNDNNNNNDNDNDYPIDLRPLLSLYQYSIQYVKDLYGSPIHGQVIVMGDDDMNQLGRSLKEDDEKDSNVKPTVIQSLRTKNIRAIAAGGTHSVALDDTGIPYTWGSSDDGTLGRELNSEYSEGEPTPVTGFTTKDGINEDGTIIQIAAGSAQTLYLSMNGNVYMNGMYKYESGKYRVLDDYNSSVNGIHKKPTHIATIPGKVISIYGTEYIGAALLDDYKTLLTWGFGLCGELARSAGMTQRKSDGTYDVGQAFLLNKETDEVNLDIVKEHYMTPKPVIFEGPKLKRKIMSVAVGSCHLCVVACEPGTLLGKVYTAGHNNYGQLGHGDHGSTTSGQRHELTQVQALKDENIIHVACGYFHTMALSITRTELWTWGRGDKCALGTGYRPTGALEALPQLVKFPERVTIKSIDAGEDCSFVIDENDEVYSWGFNVSAATGHPTQGDEDIFRPKKVVLPKPTVGDKFAVHTVRGGSQHTMMLVSSIRSTSSSS